MVCRSGVGASLAAAAAAATLPAARRRALVVRRPWQARLLSLRSAMALDPLVPTLPERKTRIVCTIGPASLDKLPELVNSGMDVARINCAHGDAAYYTRVVEGVRAACASVAPGGATPADSRRPDARHVACAFDIKGPEVRTGAFGPSVEPPAGAPAGTSKEIAVRRGAAITLTCDPAMFASGSASVVYINYPHLAAAVSVGQLVVIDDGNVELRVTEVDVAARRVGTVALTDAPIGEHKGVNLPGVRSLDLPLVTVKDGTDIALAARLGADFLFASFVQSAAHVEAVRAAATAAAAAAGSAVPRIIAKIENEAGLDRFDEILAAADGIMVARGDLGVQIAPERVYLAQKMMIARCNCAGKPVICATQMLESMTTHPRPTRAEVTDVATAVMDGADAVMLSGETAKGSFPLAATASMAAIAAAGELAFPSRAFFNEIAEEVADAHRRAAAAAPPRAAPAAPAAAVDYEDVAQGVHFAEPRISDADTETLCASAVLAALDARSPLILVLSRTGRTAAALARFRPPCPVLTLTADAAVARRLKLVRGVQSVLVPAGQTTAAMRAGGLLLAARLGWTRPGDRIVIVAGAGVLWLEGGVHVSIVTVQQ